LGGKSIPFLDENISYLGGGRGVLRALTKKNLPHVVFAFLVPPCGRCELELLESLVMFVETGYVRWGFRE